MVFVSVTDIIIQQLINGFVLGSFYSLVALGYTMVYGIIKLLNFAHGDIYMIGAFFGLLFLSLCSKYIGSGWVTIISTILATMVLVGIIGVIIQRIAYRPLLNAPRLSILISALAISMMLSNGAMGTTSGEFMAFPIDLGYDGIAIGEIFISYTQLGLIISTGILMIFLHLFINHTLYGKAMRAIAIDKDACSLMGIHVYGMVALTFFVGSALAGAAGVMAGVYYGSIHFYMGFLIGVKAFTAAVIGGIGSIPGAMAGGIILGILESLGTQIPSIGTEWKDVFAFSILILLLVFRPNGIFGRAEIERM